MRLFGKNNPATTLKVRKKISLAKKRIGQWKGDKVSYSGIHHWVKRWRGKPIKCEHCGKTHGYIEWANKDHKYKRKLSDFISLCRSCHRIMDSKCETQCKHGHQRTKENTGIDKRGYRWCKKCTQLKWKMKQISI